MEATLVNKLAGWQVQWGTSDRDMARALGISHSYWIMLRQGKRKPGRKFFVGVVKGFPMLEGEAIEMLRGM